ncbi:microtubule-associated protein 70-5-like [Andrographis paniculata]|uniref:microtubule-associated protein 70-5-like n=1 Tax=Andrographis paniculata TaxID=175694 RepID=UPI0021E88E7C|nr:microtubule-associated protein 70-5-like [Andrographis paniculata]
MEEQQAMPAFGLRLGGKDVCLLAHTHPVVLEINRLENLLKEKEGELRKARSEIRALRATEMFKDKAVEELASEVERLEEKLRSHENHLEHKSLEIKKLADEKKEALAAQYAAEATLRRVYAEQKDENSLPLELVIAPLDAEIKIHKNEVAALQEDKRALERLIKSKEVALLEAERILRSALERALVVEEVQNQNFELRRQIEICQGENKILEKTNRQKVLEVEKLSQTIRDLEEAILAGGAAANAIRDYRRQILELNEDKRMLERELARAKVTANRMATVVANEWKDGRDKVMPVKQWLEERRIFQAEMRKLKDKLVTSERAVEAEARIKEKMKLRLKILEEGLRQKITLSASNNGISKGERSNFFGILSSNGRARKRSTPQPLSSTDTKRKLRKSLWTSRNKVIDNCGKENKEMIENFSDMSDIDCSDMVSGFLYDVLQKEVINLRKSCSSKDGCLSSKDEEIKTLMKKVETLSKALEVESKKKTKRQMHRKDEQSTIL